MDERGKQLSELRSYIGKMDIEITMILQSLQWDRKHLLEREDKSICKYDSNHKVPAGKKTVHEEECILRRNGYSKQDLLFPDPTHANIKTSVKLSKEDIKSIIQNVSKSNALHEKGVECEEPEPLSLERLQSKYSVEERRAIYDVVVAHTPSHSDIAELEVPSVKQAKQKPKSKLEVLAELRDMKRRRPKYRVATKSKNYSEVLREVIKNQMEWYADIQSEMKNNDIYPTEEKSLKSDDAVELERPDRNKEKLTMSNDSKFQKPFDKYGTTCYQKHDSWDAHQHSKSSRTKHYGRSEHERSDRKRHRGSSRDHYREAKHDRHDRKLRHDSRHRSSESGYKDGRKEYRKERY